jgi:hypothetical protein
VLFPDARHVLLQIVPRTGVIDRRAVEERRFSAA